MTTESPTQCGACKHLTREGSCPAFPAFAGIPTDIILFGDDHREPRADQVGDTVFAMRDDDAARDLFSWWQRFADASAEG